MRTDPRSGRHRPVRHGIRRSPVAIRRSDGCRTRSCPSQALPGAVARRSGLHPELVRRFVALGLVDADTRRRGGCGSTPTPRRSLARIQRLHAGLCLNYAAIGLVLDLLDRIEPLEAAAARPRHEE